jgi:uncharacterized Tic20 family protein
MTADPATLHQASPAPPTPPAPSGPCSRHGRVIDPSARESERTYALFLHLTLLLVHFAVPIVPALIMWLIKRDQSPFIDDHGREALNFQISLVIYAIVGGVLIPACGMGVLLIAAAYALGIVGMVLAAVAASRGEYFRYPATIRFLH